MSIDRGQVGRLMEITGIRGVSRGMHRKRTTVTNPAYRRHPDGVNRQWTYPSHLDQWWIADFTYVWTSKGFCYVAFIADAYSRMILGWVVTMVMDTRMVLMALEHSLFPAGARSWTSPPPASSTTRTREPSTPRWRSRTDRKSVV